MSVPIEYVFVVPFVGVLLSIVLGTCLKWNLMSDLFAWSLSILLVVTNVAVVGLFLLAMRGAPAVFLLWILLGFAVWTVLGIGFIWAIVLMGRDSYARALREGRELPSFIAEDAVRAWAAMRGLPMGSP